MVQKMESFVAFAIIKLSGMVWQLSLSRFILIFTSFVRALYATDYTMACPSVAIADFESVWDEN